MQMTSLLVTMATHLLSYQPHPVLKSASGLIKPDKLKQWGFHALRPRSLLINCRQSCFLLSHWPCLTFREIITTPIMFSYLFSTLLFSFQKISHSVRSVGVGGENSTIQGTGSSKYCLACSWPMLNSKHHIRSPKHSQESSLSIVRCPPNLFTLWRKKLNHVNENQQSSLSSS